MHCILFILVAVFVLSMAFLPPVESCCCTYGYTCGCNFVGCNCVYEYCKDTSYWSCAQIEAVLKYYPENEHFEDTSELCASKKRKKRFVNKVLLSF